MIFALYRGSCCGSRVVQGVLIVQVHLCFNREAIEVQELTIVVKAKGKTQHFGFGVPNTGSAYANNQG